MVIMHHSGFLTSGIMVFVCLFVTPLFFLISGYMAALTQEEKVPYPVFFKKISHTILRTYFLFYFFDILVYAILQLIKGLPIDFFTIRYNLILLFIMYGVSVTWYLSALYLSQLLFHLYLRVSKRGRWITGSFTVLMLIAALFLRKPLEDWYVYVYSIHSGNVPPGTYILFHFSTAILRVPMCVLLLWTGYQTRILEDTDTVLRLKEKWNKINAAARILFSICGGSILYLLSYRLSLWNEVGNLAVYHYGKNVIVFLAAALAGSAGTLLFAHAIVSLRISFLTNILTYIGKNTLIILITHLDFYLLINAMRIVSHIPVINSRVLFKLPAILILTLLFEVPVIEMINRFFPFLIGRKKR